MQIAIVRISEIEKRDILLTLPINLQGYQTRISTPLCFHLERIDWLQV